MPEEVEPGAVPPSNLPAGASAEPSMPTQPSAVPSDEDRQAIILTVQQALAEDLIAFDEIDDRFARAYNAETQAELRQVVADLPDLRRSPPRPELRHLAPANSMKLIGDTKISGWLAVDDDISVTNLIGDALIDLSTADIPAAGVTITAFGLIGDIKIILPDGVRVQAEAFSLIGDTKKVLSPALPGRPTVRVKGQLLLGDVSVYSLSQVPDGAFRRLWAALRGRSSDTKNHRLGGSSSSS